MRRSSVTIELGQTPLTDVRSLSGSTFFHALLVLLAYLAVFPVALPLNEAGSPEGSLH